MGFCHVVFLPVIALLAVEVWQGLAATAFGLWSVYCLVLMSVCVLLDAFDLFRYFVWDNQSYGKQ